MFNLRLTTAALAIFLPTSLLAQNNCAERNSVVENLEASYGEAFAGGGMQSDEHLFEVWFSPEKGTWTILMTHADGRTCIMASGTNWQENENVTAPVTGIQG